DANGIEPDPCLSQDLDVNFTQQFLLDYGEHQQLGVELEYRISCWRRASSDHFPCLERLILQGCWKLDTIPQEFADITTLALIDINICAQAVVKSAKQIQQDIEDSYGGSIEVYIRDGS
uniref:Uncharacterized protein n=1 Tax=Solanum lycopersicum TaxID=4081 RepID=A0A3Q7J3K1_SOLLC